MSTPATSPKAAAAPVTHSSVTTGEVDVRARRAVPIVSMVLGVFVIVGAVASIFIGREAESEVVELAAAFQCPPGVESRNNRMEVTVRTLNVRAAPSASADRLPDRTLRKPTVVTEECRADSWSRVRLHDGRSGWVANKYLSAMSRSN
jgi:uncharacterized protein YgiM (DUF1202 family)